MPRTWKARAFIQRMSTSPRFDADGEAPPPLHLRRGYAPRFMRLHGGDTS